MPLLSTGSSPKLRSQHPFPGFTFEMTDADGATVTVLVTAMALQELDHYRKPPDQFAGREVLEAHRTQIETAASKKFDERGASETLDGQPVLLVQSMDLLNSN